MSKPDDEDNAIAVPPKLAARWEDFIKYLALKARAAKFAAGCGFEAERVQKMAILRDLVAKGCVSKSELDRAVTALISYREPDWPPEVSAAFAAARRPQTVSANRIAMLERRLVDAEAAFAGLGLPASESRILAPYVRYALDWTPFVSIFFDPPEYVVAVLGERYSERSEPLPEPTEADVADALAEMREVSPELHDELVRAGIDPQTAQKLLDTTINVAARFAVALRMAAEKGDDARLARQNPTWESAVTIGILVRTLAEPTPERVSGTEKYLLNQLLPLNADRNAAKAVENAEPGIIKRAKPAIIKRAAPAIRRRVKVATLKSVEAGDHPAVDRTVLRRASRQTAKEEAEQRQRWLEGGYKIIREAGQRRMDHGENAAAAAKAIAHDAALIKAVTERLEESFDARPLPWRGSFYSERQIRKIITPVGKK